MSGAEMSGAEMADNEESIDGIQYQPVLWECEWECDASMRKYINSFINDTCLHINHLQNYYWDIVSTKIYKLTPIVIEVLKNTKNKQNTKHKLLIFDENFTDTHNLFTMLPEHIKYITLQGSSSMLFDQELKLDMTNLPRDLIYLDIGYKFKYKVLLDYLPAGLKVLRIGDKVDVPIDNLPQGLEILEIGKLFSYNIDCLPDSIKILIFKTKPRNWSIYNSEPYYLYLNNINKLPLCLEVLIFDCLHDEVICDIDFSYLVNLTYIALSYEFDKVEFFNPSNNKWPPKLKKLHIGKTYNQVIRILPPELEFLIVHQNFNLEKNLIYAPSSLKKVMIDVCNEIIHNDNCHYGTFKKIENKFPNIKVGFLSR